MRTTDPLTSSHGTNEKLAGFVEVKVDGDTFTVSFEDADEALAAVEAAKVEAFRQYLKAGGNPRNSRSFGSQFASVKKAITKAAQS